LNKDNAISLKEFKNYIRTDKQILSCLLSFGIAKQEDIGTSFGTEKDGTPQCDPDLDDEIQALSKQVSDKKAKMKEGIDFKTDSEFGD